MTTNSWNSSVPVPVSDGGTGATSLTDHGVLVGSGTGAVTALTVGSSGQLLVGSTSADPSFTTTVEGSGDVTFQSNAAGTAKRIFAYQYDTTNSASHALVVAEVSATSIANAYLSVGKAAVRFYSWELDNTTEELSLLTAPNTAFISGSTLWNMTTAGERTMPLQPAFLATLNTNDDNVTGNGTEYILGSGNALTEIFDQGGDFVTTGTFTAPVTGRYSFGMYIGYINATGITDAAGGIVTSNRSYGYFGGVTLNSSNGGCRVQTTLADMDAGDTAQFGVAIYGVGADTVDILGSPNTTYCYGKLEC